MRLLTLTLYYFGNISDIIKFPRFIKEKKKSGLYFLIYVVCCLTKCVSFAFQNFCGKDVLLGYKVFAPVC